MDRFEKIKQLRETYESALDDAERARDEYHREIVKLHRSGASLREIAEGLGVSHQRVHQIVSPREETKPGRKGRGQAIAGAIVVILLLAGGTLFAFNDPRSDTDPLPGPVPTPEDPCGKVVFNGMTGGGAMDKAERHMERQVSELDELLIAAETAVLERRKALQRELDQRGGEIEGRAARRAKQRFEIAMVRMVGMVEQRDGTLAHLKRLRRCRETLPASVVTIDPRTGEVLATLPMSVPEGTTPPEQADRIARLMDENWSRSG